MGPSSATNCRLELDSKSPVEILKATISFRALVESDGQQLKKTAGQWTCRCPFHDDRNPSFFVDQRDDRAKCFGCDWYGDIFKYVMDRTGSDFRTALLHLASAPSLCDTKTKEVLTKPSARSAEYEFNENDLKEIEGSTKRFLNENWLCEKVAASRNWKPETIRALARSLHLGWGGDCLDFIYKTGIKVREWPGKRFHWLAGQPHIWRSDVIEASSSAVITEGEIDAITLIDLGLEKAPATVVVALASATTFSPSWASLFAGKDVTMCLDADEAGEQGVRKIAPLLQPVVTNLFILNLKEVA